MNVQLDRNQPRTPATDSRALQTLIKTEKVYADDLLTATSAALSAASSLHAWGLSETPDLDEATAVVARMLEGVAQAQKTYAQSLEQYRQSLKDMLDREHSIRSIVRDRDILLNRVIKYSQKKPSRWEMTKGEEEYQIRISDTERELHACEQTLANETAALIGVKRRTFKEALMMRAKVLGDTGAAMMDSARDMLVYLDGFDDNIPVAPVPIHAHSLQRPSFQDAPLPAVPGEWAQPAWASTPHGHGAPVFLDHASDAGATTLAHSHGGHDAYYHQAPAHANEPSAPYAQENAYANEAPAPYAQENAYASEAPAPYAQDAAYAGYEAAHAEPYYDAHDSHAYGAVPGLPPTAAPPPVTESFGGAATVPAPLPTETDAWRAPRSHHTAAGRPRMGRASSTSVLTQPATATSPPPTTRHHRRSASSQGGAAPAQLPQVPGGVPSAPRINLSHARDGFVAPPVPGGVPSAPRLFAHNTHGDAASTVDTSVVYHSTWRSQPRRAHDADSDDTSVPAHRPGAQRRLSGSGGGFFSKMSQLFRSDLTASPMPSRSSSSMGHRGASEQLFSPGRTSRTSRRHRAYDSDDSDDDGRPAGGFIRHVNERPHSSLGGRTSRSGAHTGDPALDEAIRRSVMGAGIVPQSKSQGKMSDPYGLAQGPPSAAVRSERQRHASAGATSPLPRPGSAASGPRKRSSSEQLGKPKGKGKKKKDPSAHPPPAPSSYFASALGEEHPRPSSAAAASGRTTPLKSAMKSKNATPRSKRASVAVSEPAPDLSELTLDVGHNIDGTGHIDFAVGDSQPTSRAEATDAMETYTAFLRADEHIPTAPSTDLSRATQADPTAASAAGLAPPITSLYASWQANSAGQDQAPTSQASAAPTVTWEASDASSAPAAAAPAAAPEKARRRKSKQPGKRESTSSPASAPVLSSWQTEAAAAVALASQPPPRPPRAARSKVEVAPAAERDSLDLGSRHSTWTTRIGRDDDSSDDEAPGGYDNARSAFGSATMGLDMATGGSASHLASRQPA